MRHFIAWLLGRLTGKTTEKMESHLEQHRPGQCGKVYLPGFIAVVAGICFAILIAFTVLIFYTELSRWYALLPFALALVSLIPILIYFNCRIFYDDHGFTAKNIFGVTHTFTYQDITAIKENYDESFLYAGKHRILVERHAVGGPEFLIQVKQHYSLLHPGQTLPKAPRSRLDPFNGHVSNVGGFWFGVILGTILIGFGCFSLLHSIFATSTPDNTIRQSVCFKSYYVAENELGLYSTDDQLYVIRHYGEPFEDSAIKSICNGFTTVTTYSKEMSSKYREDHYLLKAVELGGIYLLTFEKADYLERTEFWPLIPLVAVLLLGWFAFIAGAIIVGRNPKKYSQRTINFFLNKARIEY